MVVEALRKYGFASLQVLLWMIVEGSLQVLEEIWNMGPLQTPCKYWNIAVSRLKPFTERFHLLGSNYNAPGGVKMAAKLITEGQGSMPEELSCHSAPIPHQSRSILSRFRGFFGCSGDAVVSPQEAGAGLAWPTLQRLE